jgi:FHS family L-fucose permease-like MFS transporter
VFLLFQEVSIMENSSETSQKEGGRLVYKGMGVCFALLVVPFALWGAANNMTDMLVPAFQKVMSMTQLQSSLVQFAFYGAYFCMALPAAWIIKNFSYKTGVVVGLLIYAAGAALCYPASLAMSFDFFLFAFYVFAGGCAILETTVAPYVISMGPDESATRRINFAQSFNPVGSLCGLVLGKTVILAGLGAAGATERAAMSAEDLATLQSHELSNVVTAYLIVGAVSLLLGLVILLKKFPKKGETEEKEFNPDHAWGPTLGRLFKNKNWVMSVITQFFYVGCQIGVWTYTIAYLKVNDKEGLERAVAAATALGEKATLESEASMYMIYGLILFVISRFICTAIMKVVDPARLLSFISLIAVVLSAIVIWQGGTVGGYALVGISACMSLCFPTIYGLGLTGLDDNDRKLGGSGIIMSIVGGAILVPIQGFMIDGQLPEGDFFITVFLRGIMTPIKSILDGVGFAYDVNHCYIMSIICFALVCIYGLIAHQKEEEAGVIHS